MEFKSCSNEIVTFFVERQTNLGAGCCRTISTITHKCPPGVLGSIGLTIAEGNILQGHCDAATSPVAPPLTEPGFDLLPGLGTSGGQVSCLNSLMEMKSCSNEIVTFFVARKINIGPGCH
ncbi:Egg cell-secreted protein 1.3 [Morella rubra]|uniref:Egg cell-secreted protein 1.3 n=1 Tax=Morella rubra TaxID=262757 RepID=A0A6A1VET7_9ROSI|nr:Egg cell-secreted protein 1.3 [Morella rubra]